METKFMSRHSWVTGSQFLSLDETGVLNQIEERVRKSNQTPVLLFDLDSTLYEVQPRTHAIIIEWAQQVPSTALSQKLSQLNLHHVGYSLRDTFQNIGLSMDHADVLRSWEELREFWKHRFFSSDYLKHDKPYEGAVNYVNKLFSLGASIIYLTGRDEPRMGEGTRKNLSRDLFPFEGKRTHLLLKGHGDIEDLSHKKSCLEFVQKTGRLIASFENEPQNFVALHRLFPEAIHVFVETVCSDNPAELIQNAYRIRGFSSQK